MARARVVIGASFGDEGKGLMVDYLCATQGAGMVVRFNGGAQAGHTVVTPAGDRHVFKHFGSGTFTDVPTFLSQFFICNPLAAALELEILNKLNYRPALYAHPNCIAAGSMVLTDAGLIPIEDVTKSMLVWDGCEFVQHDGVVCKGVKNVIHYAGLTATSDHKVWTKEGWISFGACAEACTPIAVTGYGRIPVQERDRNFRSSSPRIERPSLLGSSMHPMWSRINQGIHELKKRQSGMYFLQKAKCTAQVVVRSMSGSSRSLLEYVERQICRLRREGDRVSFCGHAGHGRLRDDATKFQSRQTDRPEGQQRSLQTRKFALVDQKREHVEPSNSSKCAVYDITNAGKRHRFTVNGLLVSNCLVTTFADMAINQYIEDSRGDARHGSVGAGFNETIIRSGTSDRLKITMSDLWNNISLEDRLSEICTKYAEFRIGKPIEKRDDIIHKFIEVCRWFADVVHPLGIAQCKDPVFEGAQGLLLDQNNKEFFPHLTRSNTGMQNVRVLCKQAGISDIDTYYVSRTYLTRHGAGRLPGEDPALKYEDNTNTLHPYQGKLRFAPLDTSALLDRCQKDNNGDPFNLVLTHCDQAPPRCTATLYAYGPTRNRITADVHEARARHG